MVHRLEVILRLIFQKEFRCQREILIRPISAAMHGASVCRNLRTVIVMTIMVATIAAPVNPSNKPSNQEIYQLVHHIESATPMAFMSLP